MFMAYSLLQLKDNFDFCHAGFFHSFLHVFRVIFCEQSKHYWWYKFEWATTSYIVHVIDACIVRFPSCKMFPSTDFQRADGQTSSSENARNYWQIFCCFFTKSNTVAINKCLWRYRSLSNRPNWRCYCTHHLTLLTSSFPLFHLQSNFIKIAFRRAKVGFSAVRTRFFSIYLFVVVRALVH